MEIKKTPAQAQCPYKISLVSFGYSVCLYFVIFSPSINALPWINDGYDKKRILEIIIITIFLTHTLLHPKAFITNSQPFFKKKWLIITLITLGIASSLSSTNPRYAFLELSLFTGLIYFCCFIASTCLNDHKRVSLVISYSLLLSATIYMTGFFSGYIASFIENIPMAWPEPFYGFSSVRFFNQFQIWTISLLTLPILITRNLRPVFRRVLWSLISCWWILLFASNSRGAIIALIIALIATATLYRKSSLPFLKIYTTTLLCGLTGYLLLFYAIPGLLDYEVVIGTPIRTATSDRIDLWLHAIEMSANNPWLGAGPMHFASLPNPGSFSHPHNSILQWMAEWGIPSTLIMLSICIVGILKWIQHFNYISLETTTPENRQIPIVLFCSLMAGLGYSLVSGVIVMPLSQVLMVTVVGLMLGVYQRVNQIEKPRETGNNSLLLPRVLAGIILATLIWAVLPDLIPRLTGQENFLTTSYVTVGPRFWQSGGIPH